MAEHNVGIGVLVRAPDDVDVRVVQGGPVRRGIRRGNVSTIPGDDLLKQALLSSDFAVAAEVEMVPTRPGRRALRRDPGSPTQIEVQVGASESALVLLEGAGGVYAWSYPERKGPRASGRRGGPQTLIFPLSGGPGPAAVRGASAPAGKRGPVLDWIADKLIEPVRAYVLKFAARAAIDSAIDYIEGDAKSGLVTLAAPDPRDWVPGGAALPQLPQQKPLKILLMVHGTFSSTAGGFSQLTGTENGRNFLAKARRDYDAILGYDHKTLTVDPRENATAMLAALQDLGIPPNSTIDAVAHSRGGLVYRILAEDLLAAQRPDIKLGKAIFVGCTNAGTHLAEPANWAAMIDVYTNAIMAGVRTAARLAGGAALSPLISLGIKTLGRFVQSFSEVAIGENVVPGLAAMQPSSAAVKGLNESTADLERLAAYYAVTSNFVAQIEPDKGITKELAQFILDRVSNRLFQLDNDLVVDTASMTSFGTRNPRLKDDATFAFGNTDDVYHTIYFAADALPRKLGEWLGFDQPVQLQDRADKGGDGIQDVLLEATEARPFAVKRARRGASRLRDAPPPPPPPAAPPPGPAAPRPPAPAAPRAGTSASVGCYFAAEMEPHPSLGKPAPLAVIVSREKIEVADSPASAASKTPVKVDSQRKIVIEVIARKNCRIVGDTFAEIDVPDDLQPERLRFLVEGEGEGAADILVEARQGARILASFSLAPIFINTSNKILRRTQSASTVAAESEQPAVLRIYEIEEGGRLTLRFDLTCQNPNISVSESRTLASGFSRDLYVAEIFKNLENAWLAADRVYDQFLARLRAHGIVMARELLPDRVREALWRHRDAIQAIQVISEEPFIPWELLYVNDPKSGPKGKGFLAEWGLVRWLHNTPWPGPELVMRDDRVRFVIPNYLDPALQLEGAAAERQMLTGLFAKAQELPAESLTVEKFLENKAEACDVLHFACHGEAVQQAVMVADLLMGGTDVEGAFATDRLSADQVKASLRFSATGPNQLVFINACQTGRNGSSISGKVAGFVDAFLRPYSELGAGALVGALWSVNDKLAYSFAEAFYRALKDGKTLVDAAQAAREAAKDQRELTWLAYTVYGNPFARVADTLQ
ncbi:MAG: CHAT domain-containing protein [Pseudomonadota bacterium]